MTHYTKHRWAGAAVAAAGLFATTALAQPPLPAPSDPIERAKIQRELADQKAESEVLLQIDNAVALTRGNHTAKAIQTLKAAKQNLQFAAGVSEATRTKLTAVLDARIAAFAGKIAANPGPGVFLDPRAKAVKASQAEAAAQQVSEFKDVMAGIKKVDQLQSAGKAREADLEIARLAKAYPSNPSVMALGQKDSISDRLADAQAYYVESSRRWVEIQKQINESSLPAIYDVEFPKDWKEKSERRLKATRIPLTDKEKKIIEALDAPVSVAFAERPLEEALQDLSNTFDQPLLLDKKSLEDLGLDLKRGVTLQAKGISGRTALRSILATQGLTFVVKDEAIQIMTVERSKTLLTTRVYYLGELAAGGPFSGLEWGPFVNQQQQQANVVAIIDAIRKIDPLSWSGEGGGPGTITYHAPTQSLIVRNSAEVHHSLGGAFYGKK